MYSIMLCFVRCCQRHCIKYCSFNFARTPRMYSKQYFRVKKRLTIMSTLSFQSIHMEHGGLILSRKLPAIAIRNEMIIVGGESDCNYSTGNALKKQKIEVSCIFASCINYEFISSLFFFSTCWHRINNRLRH